MSVAVVVPVSGRTDDPRRWHPVSVVRDFVNIKGGYNTSCELANSITLSDDGAIHTFVELDKHAHWFLKGVGGPKQRKAI